MAKAVASLPRSSDGARTADERRIASNVLSLETQLWIVVSLLILFGVIMIYSASSIMALRRLSDPTYYMKRQLIWVGLGTGAMFLTSRIPYKWYRAYARWMLVAALVALALVLIPALSAELNSARRWFRFRSFTMQPAEYAKVIWIMYLSASLTKNRERVKEISIGFLPHILLLGLMSILLLMEPDFGTAFILGLLTLLMLAIGGVPVRHLLILAPFASLGFYQFVYRVEYRWERITAFLNPWTDPLDSGYQLIQAWIAVGAGGLLGSGLGAGHQKLFYLPEPYTDFILAVIGEELGFLGILAVGLLFLFLFWTGLRISQCAPDFFGALLAVGLTMMLSVQALLNMGVVLGLMPTKGLPLPFISYGGSAFTANCLAVGILMNIARMGGKRVMQNV